MSPRKFPSRYWRPALFGWMSFVAILYWRRALTSRLIVRGILADGSEQILSSDSLTLSTSDPGVAVVTDLGLIIANQVGTTALRIDAFGLTAATSVNVGTRDDRLLDFFPDAYTLNVSESRQLMVRERVEAGVIDLAQAASTRYFVADPSLLSIDDTGLVTAIAKGITEITVVQSGISQVIPILIADVQTGTVVVGATGAIIGDGAGITVAIPPGAYDESIELTATALASSDLPYSLPTNWNFAGGVQINYGDRDADLPMSIAIPAPATSSPGEMAYLFQPVDVTLENGTISRSWIVIDSMVVGDDGIARTTSPPNIGVGARTASQFGQHFARRSPVRCSWPFRTRLRWRRLAVT